MSLKWYNGQDTSQVVLWEDSLMRKPWVLYFCEESWPLAIVAVAEEEYKGWTWRSGVRSPMIPEFGTAAAHRFPRGWIKCGGQIWHTHVCEDQYDLNLPLKTDRSSESSLLLIKYSWKWNPPSIAIITFYHPWIHWGSKMDNLFWKMWVKFAFDSWIQTSIALVFIFLFKSISFHARPNLKSNLCFHEECSCRWSSGEDACFHHQLHSLPKRSESAFAAKTNSHNYLPRSPQGCLSLCERSWTAIFARTSFTFFEDILS